MECGVRMLIGTSPDNPLYTLLREVGVIGRVEISPLEQFHCVEDEEGERVTLFRDLGLLREELFRVAPRDRERIERFVEILDDFSRFKPPIELAPETAGFMEKVRAAWSLKPVAKHFALYRKKSLREWLDSFESDVLKRTILKIYSAPDFPVLALFAAMGWFTGGQVGSPEGGSKALVEAIKETYLGLGGRLCCGAKVKEIVVESAKAVGVRLDSGLQQRADIVISAADGHSTIFGLLKGRFVDRTILRYYRDLPLFEPLLILHFGSHRKITEDPSCIHFPLKKPVDVPGQPATHLNLYHRSAGAGVPRSDSLVRIGIETLYEPWEELATIPDRYREAKERIAAEVLVRLEERYPGFARELKATDVATPVTMVRYSGNWRGSYEGWRSTTKTFGLQMKRTLPGLERFYMVGQWVEPGGGIPGVVRSARNTIKLICHHLGVKFVTD